MAQSTTKMNGKSREKAHIPFELINRYWKASNYLTVGQVRRRRPYNSKKFHEVRKSSYPGFSLVPSAFRSTCLETTHS